MSRVPSLRRCARCGVEKPLNEFPIKSAAKGWYGSYCRPCCREYGRDHYARNVSTYVSRAKARAAIERPGNRAFVLEYLSTHPCVDCGESDPIVLEFDHREPAAKTDEVSRLVHASTRRKVELEIQKCDVRCGNCHRIRTAAQYGNYRLGEKQSA